MPSKTTKKSQSAHTSKKLSKSTELNGKRAREQSEEPTYVVEKILDKKKMDGVFKYKVKWQGYSDKECTWEPAKHLDAVKEMLAEFNKHFKRKDNTEDSEEEQKSFKDKNHKGKASNKGKKNAQEKEEEVKESSNKRGIGSPYKKVKTDEEQNDMTESVKKTSYGHFKLGDKPSRIAHAKREKDEIIFKIEWEAREDGDVPLNTEMTGLELRKYDKDLLLDFYEERLKFVKPASKESMRKSVAKKMEEEKMLEEMQKEDNQKMKEEETNETVRENGIEKSEIENGVTEGKKGHDVIDLEDSPQEIQREESVGEVQEINKSQMRTQEIGESQDVYDSTNLIDNKGQKVYADVEYNVADDIRDLALDTHLKVYSETNKDLEKEGELEKKGEELQIDSPKVSDSESGGSESSGLDNIL